MEAISVSFTLVLIIAVVSNRHSSLVASATSVAHKFSDPFSSNSELDLNVEVGFEVTYRRLCAGCRIIAEDR